MRSNSSHTMTFTFWQKNSGKILTPWSPLLWVKSYHYCSSIRIALALNNSKRLQKKKKKKKKKSDQPLVRLVMVLFACFHFPSQFASKVEHINKNQLSFVWLLWGFLFLWGDFFSLIYLANIVEGDPKAPFSIATTPRCREECYSFPLDCSTLPLIHFF